MKLGIALFIVGLVVAATGGFHWGFACSYETESAWCYPLCSVLGLALMIFGAGLGIGGIVRMILSRR